MGADEDNSSKKARGKGTTGKDSPFTVDESTSDRLAEMPSLTRLLNRKKFVLSSQQPAVQKPEASSEASEDDSPTESDLSPPEIPLNPPELPAPPERPAFNQEKPAEPDSSQTEPKLTLPPLDSILAEEPLLITPPLPAADSTASAPRIQATSRRAPQSPLHVWKSSQLQNGQDPMGKTILLLLNKGAAGALFLSLRPDPAGSNVPHFLATACAGDQSKVPVWMGLKWDPTISRELWNSFVKTGYIELAPPGTTTNQFSERNVIRSAFGVAGDEWLLLLQVGPSDACRGALALISRKSLISDIPAALTLLREKLAAQVA